MKKSIFFIIVLLSTNVFADSNIASSANEKELVDDSVSLFQYKKAIQKIISSSWYKPESAKKGSYCKVLVKQNKYGKVFKKENPKCNTHDREFISSVLDSIERINELPKARESFYDEDILLTFLAK